MIWLKRIALGIVVAVGMVAVVAAGYRGMQIMVRDAVIEALEMRGGGTVKEKMRVR